MRKENSEGELKIPQISGEEIREFLKNKFGERGEFYFEEFKYCEGKFWEREIFWEECEEKEEFLSQIENDFILYERNSPNY